MNGWGLASFPTSPFWVSDNVTGVARDLARLNLRFVEGLFIDSAGREREGLLSASLTVATAEEIKLLFVEFQGVAFHQKLKRQPWATSTFVVNDPDGNLPLFAGRANKKP